MTEPHRTVANAWVAMHCLSKMKQNDLAQHADIIAHIYLDAKCAFDAVKPNDLSPDDEIKALAEGLNYSESDWLLGRLDRDSASFPFAVNSLFKKGILREDSVWVISKKGEAVRRYLKDQINEKI